MGATIEVRPDGCLAVTGLENFTGATGKPVVHAELVVKLCRCGGSANKPFCDGTHRRNGFSGARISDGSDDKCEDYRGQGITVHDNRSICAHAGRCTDGLAAVFKYGSEPWIDPAGAPVQAIVDTVGSCPSGALTCTVDGVEPMAESWPAAIEVTRDGPYNVRGIELVGVPFAQGAARDRYTLCRCGASKNKPFCDGTHFEVGFKDPT